MKWYLLAAEIFTVMICLTGCLENNRTRALMVLRDMRAEDYFANPAEIELARAIEWGDTNKITAMLNKGIDINTQGYKDRMTFLMWSFIKQQKVSYKYLLDNGADPNQTLTQPKLSNKMLTVMNMAVLIEDAFYLKTALEHGGDPNTKDGNQSIIFEAIRNHRVENIELLLDFKADINYKNKISGDTPLIESLGRDLYNIAFYLLERGADPSIKSRDIAIIIKTRVTSEQGIDDLRKKMEYKKKVVKKLQDMGYLQGYVVDDQGILFE